METDLPLNISLTHSGERYISIKPHWFFYSMSVWIKIELFQVRVGWVLQTWNDEQKLSRTLIIIWLFVISNEGFMRSFWRQGEKAIRVHQIGIFNVSLEIFRWMLYKRQIIDAAESLSQQSLVCSWTDMKLLHFSEEIAWKMDIYSDVWMKRSFGTNDIFVPCLLFIYYRIHPSFTSYSLVVDKTPNRRCIRNCSVVVLGDLHSEVSRWSFRVHRGEQPKEEKASSTRQNDVFVCGDSWKLHPLTEKKKIFVQK